MKKALILTWEKFQDHEVIYPFYALKEHGFDVTLAGGPDLGRIFGILGAHVVCDILIEDLDPSSVDDYDLLVIPGGVKALEKLRLEEMLSISQETGWRPIRRLFVSAMGHSF